MSHMCPCLLQCLTYLLTTWSPRAGCSMLQCVAVCCSVLQCVAVCCSVLQYLLRMLLRNVVSHIYTNYLEVTCKEQCVAVCCSVLQRVAACCSIYRVSCCVL